MVHFTLEQKPLQLKWKEGLKNAQNFINLLVARDESSESFVLITFFFTKEERSFAQRWEGLRYTGFGEKQNKTIFSRAPEGVHKELARSILRRIRELRIWMKLGIL